MKQTKIILAALLLFCVSFISCEEILSDAKGQASDLQCVQPFSNLFESNMKYEIKFKVKNIGKDGIIAVEATLNCSEGKWNRKQKIQFQAGEEKELSYIFTEPSSDARNIECQAKCFPD